MAKSLLRRQHRAAAGLAQPEIPPVYSFLSNVARPNSWYALGPASLRITGDPQHEVLALARLVPPTSSDGPRFLAGHKNFMVRLRLPAPPRRPCPADHIFRELSEDRLRQRVLYVLHLLVSFSACCTRP